MRASTFVLTANVICTRRARTASARWPKPISFAPIAERIWSRRKRPNPESCLACQGEPRTQRGKLLVLSPRRTESFAERSDAPLEHSGLNAKRLRRHRQELFFLNTLNWQVA